MFILGFNCYMHDASACLIKDGEIIAFAEEERFVKKKHCTDFPYQAIKYCLKEGGIGINDIEHIGFFWKPWKGAFKRFIYFFPASVNQNPHRLRVFTKMLGVKVLLRNKLGYKNRFHYIGHHDAHIMSALCISPFKKSAFLVIDANGEIDSVTMGKAGERDFEVIKRIEYPHSPGILYYCVTEYLGFKENWEEGKVMALAAYGRPRYLEQMREIMRLLPDGGLLLDVSYFDIHTSKKEYISDKFISIFGPRHKKGEPLEQRHMDIAASLQKALEESMFHIVNYLHRVTHEENLCLSGGVALNCVMNGKLFKNTQFKKILVQPAANDAGTSLGAALYLYRRLFKDSNPRYTMKHVYYGPGYNDEEINNVLEKEKVQYYYVEDIALKCAELLSKGKIIGWFQGRMEVGPRALGNRSILADPRDAKMKDHLNSKVKHREGFRPFGASVVEEEVSEFFDTPCISPHMLFAFQVIEDKKKDIPAVLHVDGTSRIQTVSRKYNPLFWKLLNDFKRYSGVPVILNTSFNIKSRPIVCSPSDALECFLNSDMDYLVMKNFLIEKK